MARPPRSFHLQPKSGGYRARVLVPVELQGKIGKKVLYTSVWQASETEAANLAWPQVQKFEALLERARSGKFYPAREMEAEGRYGLSCRRSLFAGRAPIPARPPSPL